MVALVVTIVVLLILSTITIQGITHTGLFSSAEKAKLDHKRAYIATTLETKLKISQSEQIRGTDEEIIKATYEDVKNDLDEIKKAGGKDIEVGEVTSEEREGKTEWFFEVKVDGDVYKVALDGSDYLGKENELSPLIQIKTVKSTTNTISVSVTTKRNEGGKVEYYIKEKGSQKFDLAGTTEQNTFKYTKLKQETTYVIEAVAINTNGKKKVSKEYEIKTSLVPKIDSNEIKFASVPNEWTNKSVEVTATLTVDGQNFTLATSKNPTSGWIASNRQIFTENGTMYAALTDGNNYGIAASHEITNIDTTKPIVKSLSVTTNTIKITATDEASGIYSYAISESETMPKTFTKLDNSTQVFNTVVENLKQTTKYYVWVKDVAGNISEVASTKTGTVPKLTDANTTITKSPNDWTTQEVTATVTTTEKNYALQTKKDNGEWQTTNSQKYTENGTIKKVTTTPVTFEEAGVQDYTVTTGSKVMLWDSLQKMTPLTASSVAPAPTAAPTATPIPDSEYTMETLPLNNVVTLKATANEGYVFRGWKTESGTTLSMDDEYTFRLRGDSKIVANFVDAPTVADITDFELSLSPASVKSTSGSTSTVSIKNAKDAAGTPMDAVKNTDVTWSCDEAGVTIAADGTVTIGDGFSMGDSLTKNVTIKGTLNGVTKTAILTVFGYEYYEDMAEGSTNYTGQFMTISGKTAIVFPGSSQTKTFTFGSPVTLDKTTTVKFDHVWSKSKTCGQLRTLNFKNSSGTTIFSMTYKWGTLYAGSTATDGLEAAAVEQNKYTTVTVTVDPETKVVTVTDGTKSATTTLADNAGDIASVDFASASSVPNPEERAIGISNFTVIK